MEPFLDALPARGVRGRRILLAIGGGVAAYRAAELARLLIKHGATVRVMMTPNAQRFVTGLTFQALTGQPSHTDLWDETQEHAMGHIQLARWAELIIVAPATADLVAKMAAGIADDLPTTVVLASSCPVVVAPAMNTQMYLNEVTQDNLRRLLGWHRFHQVGPGTGDLACGETGPGRLADLPAILAEAERQLTEPDWQGLRALVTSGPTREAFDPVRFLSNHSTGKMGHALATALWMRGARVMLVSGPTALPDPENVSTVHVETAAEMRDAVMERAEACDALFMAAAVADFTPAAFSAQKIKKGDGLEQVLRLTAAPDILMEVRAKWPDLFITGFAAETGDLVEKARDKNRKKKADLLVANDVAEEGSGFGVDTNRVTLVGRDGEAESLPMMPKLEVAHAILDRVRAALAQRAKPGTGAG